MSLQKLLLCPEHKKIFVVLNDFICMSYLFMRCRVELASYELPVGPESPAHHELPSNSFRHGCSWIIKVDSETNFLKFTLSLSAHIDTRLGWLLPDIRMILLTTVARVADGLPLAASIQEDEQVTHGPPRRGSSGQTQTQPKLWRLMAGSLCKGVD